MRLENPSKDPPHKGVLVPQPRIEARIESANGKQRLCLHAIDAVRDIVIALDRLHAEAELEDQCFSLRAGERRELTIASPIVFTLEQLMSPPVFMCSNQHCTSSRPDQSIGGALSR